MKIKEYLKASIISFFLLTMILTSVQGQNRHRMNNTCHCKMHSTICSSKMTSIPPSKNNNEVANLRTSQGTIQPSTNLALPSAYNFQEYVFPEPDDQGDCQGIENTTAVIDEVFLSQTHRHAIGHPLLFTIGERPLLLQLAVTGQGAAPDVQVEGVLGGTSLGVLCLNGPATLASNIDLEQANFSDYFSVTLPKAWIQIGLQLNLSAGNDTWTLTQDDLQITPYTELNLVLVNMDIMDYNHEPHRTPVFDTFLQELAAAIPASVVRFGAFPKKLRLPSIAINNLEGNTVVVDRDELVEDSGLNTGMINYAANVALAKMQHSLGDTPNTIYFGNTLNLDPGGWGGNGSFVSFEYRDVFIHELGHALSLPHWVEDYRRPNPEPWNYAYPYEGEEGEGSGRGEAWNFIQSSYEFVSPICQDDNGIIGTERSDCMQRGFHCTETRANGLGPWDGFGDFSAKAINNYLLGSESEWGQVMDRDTLIDYHLRENEGHPIATLANGERVFTRHPSQPQNTTAEDFIKLPGEEQIEQEVYLIYGSAHDTLSAANIIYEPIKYRGTLLPVIDPTDPTTFSLLQNTAFEDAPEFYHRSRDITLKLTYIDGTESHVLVPLQSFNRLDPGIVDQELFPEYFSVVVPADELLCGVELYHRDFIATYSDIEESGNINDPSQNITAENFMDEAILIATLDHSCNCPGTPGYIEPNTPCDDGNPFTIDDVEDGFCNCEGVPIAPCGYITNGQFEETLVGWLTWGNEASSTNEEATFLNIELGNSGMAHEEFELISNELYTINFEAYASQARSIDVIIFHEDQDLNYTEYFKETVNLSATKQSYEFSFTIDGSTTINYAAIEFNFGNDEADVFLDNVCLDALSALPVSLLSFNGTQRKESVELTWKVTDEVELSHYTIERANQLAPNRFQVLDNIQANNLSEYIFLDQQPNIGVNYYRLRSVDFNGSFSYSRTIAVNFLKDPITAIKEVSIFPNPATQKINLSDGELIGIRSITGKQYPPTLDISNLPVGLYFAEIRLDGNYIVSKKFVKQLR